MTTMNSSATSLRLRRSLPRSGLGRCDVLLPGRHQHADGHRSRRTGSAADRPPARPSRHVPDRLCGVRRGAGRPGAGNARATGRHRTSDITGRRRHRRDLGRRARGQRDGLHRRHELGDRPARDRSGDRCRCLAGHLPRDAGPRRSRRRGSRWHVGAAGEPGRAARARAADVADAGSGIIAGAAGIISTVPGLAAVAVVFGLLVIVWFTGLGICLLREHVAPREVASDVPLVASR